MLIIFATAVGLLAQSLEPLSPDAGGVFAIWPGTPPGSENWTWHERSDVRGGNRMVRNVVTPTLTMYKPAPGRANGTSVIIAPGGAFRFLMVDYEGVDMAHWLVEHGVTAFVLKYRLMHTPEDDAAMNAYLQNLGKTLAAGDTRSEGSVANAVEADLVRYIVTRKRPALFRGRHFEDAIVLLCVRWYLRYSLTYRDLEEIMAERNLSVDHVTIWRWVQRYAPVLNQRIRREMRHPNRSWRVEETYVKVAGNWAYLYRAVDSAGATIEFMLSPKRDLTAARLFLRLALSGGAPSPRVINVDGHPAYASVIAELKQSGELGRRCYCRTAPYLNIIEQDHRFIKKRITASLGFRSADGAWRTIEGYEAMHAIRKGQVRWVGKADPVAQRQFIHTIFGIAA